MITVALTITDAGLTAAVLRSFYDYRPGQERERSRVMLTGFVATTVVAVALAGAMVAFREPIARWLFGRPGESELVVVIALSIPALNTWRYVSQVMRVRLQAFQYLTTTLIAATVTTALGIFGVLALGWRVNGFFFAVLVGNLIAAIYGLVVVRGGLSGRFEGFELKRMLTYGLPLVPAAVAAWSLALVDRIILSRLGSLAQVGQYAIANRLASLLIIGLTAFVFALTPFLLSIYSESPDQERAARGQNAHLPDVHPQPRGPGPDAVREGIHRRARRRASTRPTRPSGRWRSAQSATGSSPSLPQASRSRARPAGSRYSPWGRQPSTSGSTSPSFLSGESSAQASRPPSGTGSWLSRTTSSRNGSTPHRTSRGRS